MYDTYTQCHGCTGTLCFKLLKGPRVIQKDSEPRVLCRAMCKGLDTCAVPRRQNYQHNKKYRKSVFKFHSRGPTSYPFHIIAHFELNESHKQIIHNHASCILYMISEAKSKSLSCYL